MVSLAMLNTIDTSSTLIMVSADVTKSSSDSDASPKNEVLTISGISVHLHVEDKFLFKFAENNITNYEHNQAHSKA